VRASQDAIKEFISLGGKIELTAMMTMLSKPAITVQETADAIRLIGFENIVLSSDVYFDWLPPHMEKLRMFVGQLRRSGITDAELRTMLVDNPTAIINPGS
jgi:microsomal dipeptidase-like Zn-dependent dipeptidase